MKTVKTKEVVRRQDITNRLSFIIDQIGDYIEDKDEGLKVLFKITGMKTFMDYETFSIKYCKNGDSIDVNGLVIYIIKFIELKSRSIHITQHSVVAVGFLRGMYKAQDYIDIISNNRLSSNSIYTKLQHIRSEINEAAFENANDNWEKLKLELADIILVTTGLMATMTRDELSVDSIVAEKAIYNLFDRFEIDRLIG